MSYKYDYYEGKKRVEAILNARMSVIESDKLPKNDDLTFENSYHSWVSAIFIDIRNSTSLMSNEDQEYVGKAIRSFTSELIEILRESDNLREIGIRGDCVYAIYTTPYQSDILALFDKAVWCNCCINMLNALFRQHGYKEIHAGIGLASGHDHVVKAGRKGIGINAHVWMGEAVSTASKLSGYGEKNGIRRIVMSSLFFNNIIEGEVEENGEEARNWFYSSTYLPYGCKHCSVVKLSMDSWINEGMK